MFEVDVGWGKVLVSKQSENIAKLAYLDYQYYPFSELAQSQEG